MFRAGRLPRRRDCASDRLLIIGYEGADLPHADREASVLRAMFGDRAHYLRGLACTKKRVVEELCGEYGFVHFICHATYDTERPHESSLYFRDSHTADAYRLRANEIREFVRFKDDPVVTLSACSTALTADSRSNTWHGLPGSLLESGARCIIGTRWPVADRVAEEMMGGLYELMLTSDRSPAACLHALQDQLRDRRPVEEWSCFGYLGTP
jgi:CHAT domain-containing protein